MQILLSGIPPKLTKSELGTLPPPPPPPTVHARKENTLLHTPSGPPLLDNSNNIMLMKCPLLFRTSS